MSIKVLVSEDESITRAGIQEYAEYEEINDKNLKEAANYGNKVLKSLNTSNGNASENQVWVEVNGVKTFCPIYGSVYNPLDDYVETSKFRAGDKVWVEDDRDSEWHWGGTIVSIGKRRVSVRSEALCNKQYGKIFEVLPCMMKLQGKRTKCKKTN